MATYTVTGHPLNYFDIGVSEAKLPIVAGALLTNGVGATVAITLSAPDDLAVKDEGVLE
jgi:hypothetical protein